MSAICSLCGSDMTHQDEEGTAFCIVCENQGLHKRIKELKKALVPFATAHLVRSPQYYSSPNEGEDATPELKDEAGVILIHLCCGAEAHVVGHVTKGDFLRAAAALE